LPFTLFEFPFCFAVPTRFLLRTKQQQQSRKIKGLSVMRFSIERVSAESIWSLIDFELSLKQDAGRMYIFLHALLTGISQKLDQLRAGQFYCHFMAYFLTPYLLVARSQHSQPIRSTIGLVRN
jgi:hypothetical protein